jgi:hypothetical protein
LKRRRLRAQAILRARVRTTTHTHLKAHTLARKRRRQPRLTGQWVVGVAERPPARWDPNPPDPNAGTSLLLDPERHSTCFVGVLTALSSVRRLAHSPIDSADVQAGPHACERARTVGPDVQDLPAQSMPRRRECARACAGAPVRARRCVSVRVRMACVRMCAACCGACVYGAIPAQPGLHHLRQLDPKHRLQPSVPLSTHGTPPIEPLAAVPRTSWHLRD